MLIETPFPLRGKDVNWSLEQQPPLTSGDLENVRPYDVFETRARGGQRPAVRKWGLPSRIGGNHRINKLVFISKT